eukprot:1516005-Alexandrium_andersonii.AAC.1
MVAQITSPPARVYYVQDHYDFVVVELDQETEDKLEAVRMEMEEKKEEYILRSKRSPKRLWQQKKADEDEDEDVEPHGGAAEAAREDEDEDEQEQIKKNNIAPWE